MNQTIQYVKLWLGNNRPDIKINDREVIATSVYEEIKSQIENLEEGARLIYIQEFLNLNYLKSAYNLVKDVFEEFFPEEYKDYQRTPIFFEINEDILLKCLNSNIILNYNQIFDEEEFNNNEIREKIKICIKEVI
jgi:hypothetical protein